MEIPVILRDMNPKTVIVTFSLLWLLLNACGDPNSKNRDSEPDAEPKPQTALEWANHGTRLLNKGLPERALVSYDRALQLDSTNPYMYCSKASAYHKLGQPELALQSADLALRVDSNYTPAMANKAKALRELGRVEEADSLLLRAFAIDSTLKRFIKE